VCLFGGRLRPYNVAYLCAYPTNSALDGKSLAESDLDLLCAYTLKVEDHLSDRTFNRFAKTFPNSSHETLKMTKKRGRLLDSNLCDTAVV